MKAESEINIPRGNEVPVKSSFLSLTSAVAALLIAAATAAQSPGSPQSAGAPPPPEPRVYPAPANLKVLPKDTTGQQVHEIMEQWAAALGAGCESCHATDPNSQGPDGRPRLNSADDSKGMKSAARLMYTMTEKINVDYVAKIDSSGLPVTCGTCHRGHMGPEPFAIAPNGPPPVPQAPPPSIEKNLLSQESADQ